MSLDIPAAYVQNFLPVDTDQDAIDVEIEKQDVRVRNVLEGDPGEYEITAVVDPDFKWSTPDGIRTGIRVLTMAHRR